MKTEERMSEIGKRAGRATPGPWTREKPGRCPQTGFPDGMVIGGTPGQQTIYTRHTGGAYPSADANFIADAREDVPWLLEQLTEARGMLREIGEKPGAFVWIKREVRKFLDE